MSFWRCRWYYGLQKMMTQTESELQSKFNNTDKTVLKRNAKKKKKKKRNIPWNSRADLHNTVKPGGKEVQRTQNAGDTGPTWESRRNWERQRTKNRCTQKEGGKRNKDRKWGSHNKIHVDEFYKSKRKRGSWKPKPWHICVRMCMGVC